MVEYRIAGAEFLSAAVIAVCFVIALIVIKMQDPGKSRTAGVLGVVLILGSMVLEAINQSVAGAYGTNTVVYAVGSIIVGVLAAGGLVLLALAVVWVRKARRPRGDH